MLIALTILVLLGWVWVVLCSPSQFEKTSASENGKEVKQPKPVALIVGYACCFAGFGLAGSELLLQNYASLFSVSAVTGIMSIRKNATGRFAGVVLILLTVVGIYLSHNFYIDRPPRDGTAKVMELFGESKPSHIEHACYGVFGHLDGLFLYRFETSPENVDTLVKHLGLRELTSTDQ